MDLLFICVFHWHLRYLGNIDIPTDYVVNGNVKIPTNDVILLYEIFEKLVENTLPNLKAVYVKLENSAGVVLKITLEGVSTVLDEDTKKNCFRQVFL